jgi:stalled ribosome alternative rescue factor ArfA
VGREMKEEIPKGKGSRRREEREDDKLYEGVE